MSLHRLLLCNLLLITLKRRSDVVQKIRLACQFLPQNERPIICMFGERFLAIWGRGGGVQTLIYILIYSKVHRSSVYCENTQLYDNVLSPDEAKNGTIARTVKKIYKIIMPFQVPL